jgi:putative hydrolase of the HAD superfamily
VLLLGGKFMYQNYLFDLYGTLVDIHANEEKMYLWKKMAHYMALQGVVYSPAELKKAYKDTFWEVAQDTMNQKKGMEQPEHPMTVEDMEPEMAEMIRRMYGAKNVEVSKQQIAHWALTMRSIATEYIRLFEGAEEMLERLKSQGKRIFLLSNAQRLFTEPEMRMLGIYGTFDDIFYSSDIGFKKPSWYFYDALMRRHDLALKETVMVGNDWLADAWGAANYGLDSIYIDTEQSTKLTGKLPERCRQIQKITEVE